MTGIARQAQGSFPLAAIFALAIVIAVLAASMPIQFSVATVFLFAGPHNWIEFRYFLTRLPARFTHVKPFFLMALFGSLLLSATYVALAWSTRYAVWQSSFASPSSLDAYRIWNSAFILWVTALIHQRSRENPRRDWLLPISLAMGLLAFNWATPQLFSVGMVYLHPLVAFWVLDREIKRMRPAWLHTYRQFLLFLPLLAAILCLQIATSPDLLVWDPLTRQIISHAGTSVLTNLSSHLLVTMHVFLEMLHYAVWLVAIPIVAKVGNPFSLNRIPITSRSGNWSKAVTAALAIGALMVVALYICFGLDFTKTRDLYFTIAIVHVLCEAPFLLRLL